MKAVNPANGQLIRDYPNHDAREVEERIAAASRAFPSWRARGFAERSEAMRGAARLLRARRGELALLMTEEMGKPIVQAEGEIDKCAWACEHFADHAEEYLATQVVATDASRSFVRCDPLGVVLAVMPWNFPFWQVFRAACPALMAGNVLLLKHASNVPGCALAIEALFRDADLPQGAFATVLVPGAAAESLIEHAGIHAVTLTGSEAAGVAIAARAGRSLKKIVLELGGSDPFLVLRDADLEAVAGAAVTARAQNSGQSCIAAKRFLVEEPVAERFESAFAARMASLRVGDPMDRRTEVGPLAREDLLDALDAQVRSSVAMGAHVAAGGARLQRSGFYYAPTVLTGVRPGMAAFDEETFGPVAAVTRVRDAAHAVELANRSRFGLGASIWTGDAQRGEALAAELEAGSVFINGMVKSDPRLPFGGVKRSGHGRELAAAGMREFVNLKTVWVK